MKREQQSVSYLCHGSIELQNGWKVLCYISWIPFHSFGLFPRKSGNESRQFIEYTIRNVLGNLPKQNGCSRANSRAKLQYYGFDQWCQASFSQY